MSDVVTRMPRTKRALAHARDAAYQAWRQAKDAVMWLDDEVGGELLATAQGAERQAWATYDALVQATGALSK